MPQETLMWLLGSTCTVLSMAVAALLKMSFNHLEHLRSDIEKVRDLLVTHLRDHGQ